MPVLCVIPARLGSSRLPKKPLLPVAGEPLILWVVRRVADIGLVDRIVVATDAREVADVVARAGFEAVRTSPAHASGTERVAEVAKLKAFSGFDLLLNVQGDEPLVATHAVRGALDEVRSLGESIGTAAGKLDPVFAGDPNRVKVVVNDRGHALYFSRAPIPFDRDGKGDVVYHQHVGVYAYGRAALERWVALPPVAAERAERLEQLRPLVHGMRIGVALYDEAPAPGVDTPDDLRRVEALFNRNVRKVTP